MGRGDANIQATVAALSSSRITIVELCSAANLEKRAPCRERELAFLNDDFVFRCVIKARQQVVQIRAILDSY